MVDFDNLAELSRVFCRAKLLPVLLLLLALVVGVVEGGETCFFELDDERLELDVLDRFKLVEDTKLAEEMDMFFLSVVLSLLDSPAPFWPLLWFMCAAMFDLYNRSNTEVLLRELLDAFWW